MTTSAPAASGVTIAAAGSGGVLTGQAGTTDLDGLFAALISVADGPIPAGMTGLGKDRQLVMPVSSLEEDVQELPTEFNVGMQIDGVVTSILDSGLQATQNVQLGDAPVVSVSGDAKTLSAFVQHLKDIYQKVVVEGGLTIGKLSDSTELAGALEKLGLSKDEALGVAERIQTMLKILEQQQEVDEKTAGSLVAMMLAVMGQQMPVVQDGVASKEAPEFGLQFISVVETAVPKNAAPQGRPAGWHVHVGGDIARDLLGLDKTVEGKVEAAKNDVPTELGRKVEVAVTSDAEAVIAVAMPEVKAMPVPAHVPQPATYEAQPSAAAQAANVVVNDFTAQKVNADDKIEAPKGETYYKLQADKDGVETLQAVRPVADTQEAAPLPNQTSQMQTSMVQEAVPAHMTAAGAGFAERVAQVQDMVEKAGVGKQVVVQMQPLLEQGGGTVRINLNPRELGQITVDLTVRDGQVHGSIAASDPAVVEQLARDLHSLRHGLADAGLKLGEQGINLMLSNSGDQQQNQGQGGQNGSHAGNGSGGRGTGSDGGPQNELASSVAAWVAPDRVLDVNV